jgi:hypothetical protein
MMPKSQNNSIYRMHFSCLVLTLILLVNSCSSSIENKLIPQPNPKLNHQNNLPSLADSIISVLASSDWKTLSMFVHPGSGLRFSPYAYVDMTNDLVFSRTQLENINSDTQVYYWGIYDGTGDPIELTFIDYYNRFIYNKNYKEGQRGTVNQILHKGNTIINILDVYADRSVSFIEYYVPGTDERYAGMDWGSIRLVFEDYKNRWYLIGIVHDEWTI